MLEVTYLDGDREKAVERGHVHLRDLLDNVDLFENKHIIFVHMSQKYWSHGKIVNILRDSIPPDFLRRCAFALRAFGADEDITRIPSGRREPSSSRVGFGWAREVHVSGKKPKTNRTVGQDKKTMCHFYSSGSCRNGPSCPYAHEG